MQCSVQCAVQCAVHSAQCTVCSVQCAVCSTPSEKVFRDGKFLQRRLSIDLLGCWPGKKVLCINRVNEEELGADKKMGKLK